jgi:branched-chain amino acid transport system substrate-binding protein
MRTICIMVRYFVFFLLVILFSSFFSRTEIYCAEPFKIGVLAPLSGTYAKLGDHEVWGIKVAVDKVNAEGGLLGKKVEIVVEDDELNPTLASRKATKMILQDKVEYLIGAVSSGVSMALMPIAAKYEKVHIVPISGSPQITEDKCSRNTFKVGSNFRMQALAIGPWLVKNLGRKVYYIGADYAMGQDGVKVAKEAIEKAGGQTVGEVFAPLGTTDFGPYINKIKDAKPAVVFMVVAGNDAVRLVTQLDKFGIKKMAKLAGFEMTIDTTVLEGMGESAFETYGTNRYVFTLDTQRNNEFRNAYKKYSSGEEPDQYSQASWESIMFLAKGTRTVGSTDTKKIIDALEQTTIDSMTGPVYIWKENHQAIRDKFIVEVVKDGTYKVIARIPGNEIKGPNLCNRW